jgi:hypothetical protein
MQTAEDVSEGTGNAKCKYQTCPYFLLCRNGCALSLARVENPAFRAIGAVSGRLEVANGKADWLEAATASGRGRPARLMSEHSVLETEPCQESNGVHVQWTPYFSAASRCRVLRLHRRTGPVPNEHRPGGSGNADRETWRLRGSEGGSRLTSIGLKLGQYPSTPIYLGVDSLIQASYNLGIGYRFCFECY